MTFAKQTVFEIIRAVRRLGRVGVFGIGLAIGSMLIASSSESLFGESDRQARFAADASVGDSVLLHQLPSQPWSRVMGDRQFERVTDVTLTDNQDVVFAGLSLGVGHNQSSHAVLVRTGPHGFVHAQSRVSWPGMGSVSRVSLDNKGAARLVHWRGVEAAFASVDSGGRLKWNRSLSGAEGSVWADIESAADGESLVVLARAAEMGASVRIVRLDDAGKQLWRRDLDVREGIESVSMFDSEDRGALIALEALDEFGLRTLDLVRLDWRGQIAWTRTVYEGRDARLADAAMEPEGSVVLVSGMPSALYRFDGLGQINWVRHLPRLDAEGHHQVVRGETGDIQVLAEPLTSAAARRHWLARFNMDGRELWSRTRANRMNATFEAAQYLPNGMVIAGGSLMSSATGDTDMLMLAVGDDGSFPSGYGAATALPSVDPDTVGKPSTNSPMLAASVMVDGSMTLQAAYSADRAASNQPEPVRTRPLLGSVTADDSVKPYEADTLAGARDQTAEDYAVLTSPAEQGSAAMVERREVSAPVPSGSLAATPAASLADSRVNATLGSSLSEVLPARQTSYRPVASRSSPAHDYRCTFTCLAQSDDIVKYPVTKRISDVSEENSTLVALDVMAMDHGVCLATGGSVFSEPRLPPVCDRLN